MSERTGNAESLLACPVCGGKGFRDQEQLAQHVSWDHECPECGVLLPTNQDRSLHLSTLHGKVEAIGDSEVPTYLRDLPAWTAPNVPATPQARCEWLLPLCRGIAEAGDPRPSLRGIAAELFDPAKYVVNHLRRIADTMNVARYRRLTSTEAKAGFLARALTDLEHSPSYADQLFRSRLRKR